MSGKKVLGSLVVCLLMTYTEIQAIPITAPIVPDTFMIALDDTSCGTADQVCFEFMPQDTGTYSVVVCKSGASIYDFYNTRTFDSLPISYRMYNYSIGGPYGDIYVCTFNVANGDLRPRRFRVRLGGAGVSTSSFILYVCVPYKLTVKKMLGGVLIDDTLVYVPKETRFRIPKINAPLGTRFTRWNVASGQCSLDSTQQLTPTLDMTSNTVIEMVLEKQVIPVIDTGMHHLTVAEHGYSRDPYDGILFRFDAPQPGYYGYRVDCMGSIYWSATDSVLLNKGFKSQTNWENMHMILPDSVEDGLFIHFLGWSNDLAEKGCINIELQKASLKLQIDTVAKVTSPIPDSVPRISVLISNPLFVPGWEKQVYVEMRDYRYKLDSFEVLEGKAEATQFQNISLSSDARIRPAVSIRSIVEVDTTWNVFDMLENKWDWQRSISCAMSFRPPSTGSWKLTAVWTDTLARTLTCEDYKRILYSYPSSTQMSAGKSPLSLSFWGIRDSTYYLRLTQNSLDPSTCNGFAVIVKRMVDNLPPVPEICPTTATRFASTISSTYISHIHIEQRYIIAHNGRVTVYSLNGKKMTMKQGENVIIDRLRFPGGIYFAEFLAKDSGTRRYFKFVEGK